MSAAEPRLHTKYARAKVLGERITELVGYINAATYDLLVMIREFETEGLWQDAGVCSCAHWLNWQFSIDINAAREKVRVANVLGELPKISKAFRNGEISYSKVRAMTRVAHAGNEDYLLMIARHGTDHHVETLVRGYRRAVRLNDESLQDKRHEQRSVSYRWDDDGALVFQGRAGRGRDHIGQGAGNRDGTPRQGCGRYRGNAYTHRRVSSRRAGVGRPG